MGYASLIIPIILLADSFIYDFNTSAQPCSHVYLLH